jgi:hypothetical protein
MARLLRSGVKRKFHAPFCSGGRGREAPPYRNWAAQNPHNLSIEVNATLPLRLFKQAFLSEYFSYAVLGGISIDKLFLFSQTMLGAAQVIDKLNSFEATSVGRSLYVRDCCKVGGLQKAARLG